YDGAPPRRTRGSPSESECRETALAERHDRDGVALRRGARVVQIPHSEGAIDRGKEADRSDDASRSVDLGGEGRWVDGARWIENDTGVEMIIAVAELLRRSERHGFDPQAG